ncbi:MAG: Gfo/Idh/MocA family oxidoreductase [Proteobacteria bacterium]|nr:Gfo/Idh/MocA family oxidoreductase [Pseudomonadota bacterium]
MTRIGIISTARINHLGMILPSRKRNDVILEAIASQTPDKVKKYALENGFNSFYDNYDALINAKNIDAVYISLPNIHHFEYIEKCILAQKHVLCEKPICLSYEELIYLDQLARKHNVFIMEALHYYFYPPLINLVKVIKSEFKRIDRITLFLGFPPPPKRDIRLNPKLKGGAFNHLGCYLLHFLTWVLKGSHFKKTDFNQVMLNGVDIKTKALIEAQSSIFTTECDITVSFDHSSIESFATIEGDDALFLKINHAFTPTSFYDLSCPHKNILSIESNHPSFQSKISIHNLKNFTTYDYQLEYFIKRLNSISKTPEIHLDAYRIKNTLTT